MAEKEETSEMKLSAVVNAAQNETTTAKGGHGFRFWGTFLALCLLAFISALDVAIITTVLPTITADIGGAEQYIWIANSFVVASSVFQPLVGQLANIFGRRIPLIVCTGLFALGSGIAGGANSVGMLITGRAVQGVGAGGVYVLLDIVCCDLVPLRQRGKYLGLMNSWSGIAAGIGPVAGGALAEWNWRWIFYINIPICGVALGAILLFMRVKSGTKDNELPKVQQVDWIGNLMFTPSMVALLLGLVMGGIQYPWSSWRILVPLILGVIGWIAFHVQQWLQATKYPSVPARLFSNRTSATAYILTFTSSITVQALSYFLPVWFQAVWGSTVLQSGVNFLPFAIGTLFFAVVGGVVLSKVGAYRPIHAAAFALSAIGTGLFTLLDAYSTVKWVIFQLLASVGSGMALSTLLPAIMAGLPESDVAAAAAVYSFVRTFGYIWGVTMPSIIFNAVFNHNLSIISSGALRDQLRDGKAYAFASQMHLLRESWDEDLRRVVAEVFSRSLRAIWWVGVGISVLSFFAVGAEKNLELRENLDTEYGIENEKKVVDASRSGGENGGGSQTMYETGSSTVRGISNAETT